MPHSTHGGWLNVQSARVQRDAKRHAAVGAIAMQGCE